MVACNYNNGPLLGRMYEHELNRALDRLNRLSAELNHFLTQQIPVIFDRIAQLDPAQRNDYRSRFMEIFMEAQRLRENPSLDRLERTDKTEEILHSLYNMFGPLIG